MTLGRFISRKAQRGAAMVEYALLLGAVSLIMIVGFSMLGHKTNDISSLLAVILPGAHEDDDAVLTSGALIETTTDDGDDATAGTADDLIVLDVSKIGAADDERLLNNANINNIGGGLGVASNSGEDLLPE